MALGNLNNEQDLTNWLRRQYAVLSVPNVQQTLAAQQRITGTKTWDPASIADGAQTNTTVTVTGAALGNIVLASFSLAVPAGAILSGQVTAANTVTVTLFNKTGGALDLASGTLRADVWQ